jgi:hypothetical protein
MPARLTEEEGHFSYRDPTEFVKKSIVKGVTKNV